jgi:hypothetical protein
MSSARIAYSQHPEVTAEAEVSVLATVYTLCLERSHAKKGATRPGSPDDAKGSRNDRARTIIPDK